jgi:hypothetical protein
LFRPEDALLRPITLISIIALLVTGCVRHATGYPVYLPTLAPAGSVASLQETLRSDYPLPNTPTPTPGLIPAETEPVAGLITTLSPSPASGATAGIDSSAAGEGAGKAEAAGTPAPSPTAQPFDPDYIVQAGTPISTTNFLHLDEGCSWAGLSGQVFAGDGSPVTGLVIEVRGEVDDQPIQAQGTTGVVRNLGAGGYEVQIKDSPVQAGGDFLAQVFEDGLPVSEPASFSLSQGCEHGLVLLNFVASASKAAQPEKRVMYFPSVLNRKTETP